MPLSQIEVIKSINKALEPFIDNEGRGNFLFENYRSSNIYRLRITGENSKAFDDYGNGGDFVNVIKWFSDYWIFTEIKFIKIKEIIITLSIFQGEHTDDYKHQLFRAEWDDYGDYSMNHPQPHWHFLSNNSLERTVASFAEMASRDIHDTFEEALTEEKNKTINMNNFHFAMNGDWMNTSKYIHTIENNDTLSKWFGGLLAYLKTELKYIDEKRGL